MALGNTPNRLTNIFLERNKSFALNVRFKLDTGELYDLTGATVRLTADEPQRYGSTQILTLEAEHIEPENGWAQFKFQASDLDLEPQEYAYDITLLSAWGYTTPTVKGVIVIGANTDEVNDNVFDVIHPTDEIIATFNSTGDVEICLNMADGLVGPPGDQGPAGLPTGLYIQPDTPPDPSAVPPMYFPLWVDTDADYKHSGYVYEAPEPDPTMPLGVLYFDNDETNIPTSGTGVLYVKALDGSLVPVTRIGPPGPPGPPGMVIVSPDPPSVVGLPEGAMWVDEDSDVSSGGGGSVGMDQATADLRYVNVTGDVVEGNLAVNGEFQSTSAKVLSTPSLSNHVVPKSYVDTRVLPVGGTSGQMLAKFSDSDYDTAWVPAPTGGGGGGGSSWEIVATPAAFPGIDPTGATSSTTGLTAFIAAIPNGGTGVIPSGTYLLSTKLVITNRSVHIKAEGAQFVIGNTSGGVQVVGSWGTVYNVSSLVETTRSGYGHTAETLGVTDLTLSTTAPAWKRGDLVKVVADDIPVDPELNGLRAGQSMTVLSVSGSVVTLIGHLRDAFTTNVRIAKWNDYPFSWTGGTFSATDALLAGSTAINYVMNITGMVEPVVSRVSVTSAASQAFQPAYCYGPRFLDCNIDYAQDYGGKYGYGINDSSEFTRVSGLHARQIRHAYTTGANGTTAGNSDITKFGRPYGCIVENSVVTGATHTGWDTHGDADNISFINCIAVDCYNGFSLRGTNHRVIGCVVLGHTHNNGIVVSVASTAEWSYGSVIGGGTVIDNVTGIPIVVQGDTGLAVEDRPTYIDGVIITNRDTTNPIIKADHSTAWVGAVTVPTGGTRLVTVNSGVIVDMPRAITPGVVEPPVPPKVITFRNNAENAAADGTVVTSANSGGTAGTAFTATGVNGSPVFSTTRAYGGTLSYRFVGVDATQSNVGWATQSSESITTSFNIYWEALPTVAQIFVQIRNAAASMVNLRLGTDGKVTVLKGLSTVLLTAPTALTMATWYRVEMTVARGTTAFDGRVQVGIYLADSLTPVWSYVNNSADMGTTDIVSAKYGHPHTVGAVVLHIDNLAIAATPPGM